MIGWVLRALAVLVLLLGLAAITLYLVTRGDYPVAATVTDDPTLPRITIGGVTLHSEQFGDPAKPTIIALHGGPGADYRSIRGLRALADSYHVVFYDQRGAGLSERVPAEALTLQSHLEELDGVITAFSPDAPVILIGHSWGAMLASAYLGRAPEKVARAVLIEPGMLSAAEAEAWMAHAQSIMSGPEFYWQAVLSGFRALHVSGPDPEARGDFIYAQMVDWFANHPENSYHCPGVAFDNPGWRPGATAAQAVQAQASEADLNALSDRSHRFAGPVLLMAGACNDWIGPPLQSRHLSLYQNARLHVIPDTGHALLHDKPDAALSEIRAFLAP